MSNRTIALGYCTDNAAIAAQLEQQLGHASYHFQHYTCKKSDSNQSLSLQLLNQRNPILLVISDNFLKSAQCMSDGLQLLQEKRTQILTVVVDGVSYDEATGEATPIKTNFKRVSEIIQYINYWQDQYLDLRRQKRTLEVEDEVAFNNHLKKMRDISSEAGEFLRMLRTLDCLTLEEFKENGYAAFFKYTNDPHAWEQYKGYLATQPQETILQEPAPVEEEVPQEVISNIPGMDLVQETTPEPEPEPEPEVVAEPEPEPIPAPEPITTEIPLEINHIEETAPEEEDLEEEEEEDPNEWITQGVTLINDGQTDEGMALIEQAVRKLPENAALRYRYALLLTQKKGNLAKASEELERLLEYDPDYEDAYFLLGELAELDEDFGNAVQWYERLIELNPNYPNVYYRLGLIVANQFENKEEQAAKYFERAIENKADNVDAHYQYAVIQAEKLNDKTKAIDYFERTLALQPKHPFANYDIALLHHQNENVEAARVAYLQAISINPELQTAENDEAFNPPAPPIEVPEPVVEVAVEAPLAAVATPTPPQAVAEPLKEDNDSLNDLQDRIGRLEELLKKQTELSLKAAMQQQAQQEQIKAMATIEPEPEPPAPERVRVDQTVFISGATAGIGLATARVFAEHGYRVILNGRRTERLEELQEELVEAFEAETLLLPFDVRDNDAIEEAVGQLEGKWAEIDILINNAGKAKGLDPINTGQLEHWEEMIDTNVKGLLYLTRAISPIMVERQAGQIVNVGSIAGKEVYPKGGVYCATKHAVDALTRAMRLDLHQHNIRVNQVSPGHVEETEFAAVRFDGDQEKAKIYEDFKPLTARDVAEVIHFTVTRPAHVNIQDIVLMGTQQASAMTIDRSGRARYESENGTEAH